MSVALATGGASDFGACGSVRRPCALSCCASTHNPATV